MRRFLILGLIFAVFSIGGCTGFRRMVVGFFSFDDKGTALAATNGAFLVPTEKAATEADQIQLQAVASGFENITDIQFLPGKSSRAVVLEKAGKASVIDFSSGRKNNLFSVTVATASELGLLGLAFHPDFSKNRKFYVHYNPKPDMSRIAEWQWEEAASKVESGRAKETRVLLEVEQPYQNHNGGSLAFGPDRMLYIGFGDGGWRGDPENRAQNPSSLMGKMLRIDINAQSKDLKGEYGIPSDNPFLNQKDFRPEIFALGLRNPWKYSFDRKGRLVAGDVGQDKCEEITFVPRGSNLGWRVFEASHCFDPGKKCESLLKMPHVNPLAEYDHTLGASVVGGFDYTGSEVKPLMGRYVFGDFVSGRIWSVVLPDSNPKNPLSGKDLNYHGKWNILISTFARDSAGEIYVADYSSGGILKIVGVK